MYQQVSFDGVSALNNRGNNLFMYPSVDAVEEFKVQATNYTAEYGGHAGANVQLQLKSGSNNLHGSVFEYMRNDALDARNYFAQGADVPSRSWIGSSSAAWSAGRSGATRRSSWARTKACEETRETVAQTNVLTEAMRRGDFSAVPAPIIRDPLTGLPFPGNIIPSNRLDPLAVSMIDSISRCPIRPAPTTSVA